MAKKALKNLHVPLSEETYRALKLESQESEKSATTLAREAIVAWIDERRRARLRLEIADYARRAGGTSDDLDKDIDKASDEELGAEVGRRRKR